MMRLRLLLLSALRLCAVGAALTQAVPQPAGVRKYGDYFGCRSNFKRHNQYVRSP